MPAQQIFIAPKPTVYKTPAASITVETGNFEFVHGRAPRGTGAWLFGSYRNTPAYLCFEFTGSYSEAASAARKWASKLGLFTVHVQS